MKTPFPGMDPYLEHPRIWTGVHARLINVISQQLSPLLRPRYVASIEERVIIDLPSEQRIPDIWIQRATDRPFENADASSVAIADPVMLEAPEEDAVEYYLEILDRYQELRVVTVIQVISPKNKAEGSGRTTYQKKQMKTFCSTSHLVEIDLLRTGERVNCVPEPLLSTVEPFDYVISVSRAWRRSKFEVYPLTLEQRLPRFRIPLSDPDPDVLLDLQAAFAQVYEDGSYMLRVHYDRPCNPPLDDARQAWADERWRAYRGEHPEFFGA